MSSVRPNAGAEGMRLLEQQAADRVHRAALQAKIHQASAMIRIQEAALSLPPEVSPLLDLRV